MPSLPWVNKIAGGILILLVIVSWVVFFLEIGILGPGAALGIGIGAIFLVIETVLVLAIGLRLFFQPQKRVPWYLWIIIIFIIFYLSKGLFEWWPDYVAHRAMFS